MNNAPYALDVRIDGLQERIDYIQSLDSPPAWLLQWAAGWQRDLNLKKARNVYIVRFGHEVKIGVAVNVESRISTHEKATGEKGEIIAVFPGDTATEGALCRMFESCVVRGREWFDATRVVPILNQWKLPEQVDEMLEWWRDSENHWYMESKRARGKPPKWLLDDWPREKAFWDD